MVARDDKAVLLGLGEGLGYHGVGAHEGRREHRHDAAHDLQVPDRGLARRDREDRSARAVLGDLHGRGPGLGQRDDELAVRVDGGLHGRGAHRLHGVHGAALHHLHPGCQVQAGVVEDLLGGLADLAHDRHGLHRVAACRRLTGKHHGVRAIQHSVCNVAGLGARGPRRVAHGLEHLRCGDHGLAHPVAVRDHHLLRHKDVLGWDLHA
mmetsp:Transcript_46526/g.143706  ORF Transcript_46526/g.143706 Transcript_46526/m.143706 type:complete len:208 (+) Transcript_46526:218-841(+)